MDNLLSYLQIGLLVLIVVLLLFLLMQNRRQPSSVAWSAELENKHRAMLSDLHQGLNQQSERLLAVMEKDQHSHREQLFQQRELLHQQSKQLSHELAEQGRAQQETLHAVMKHSTETLTQSVNGMMSQMDSRLNQISGKVSERLDEGFKKTNETFVNVMSRLAAIDEAQKKIDGLTSNVVSLQQLLGDKRTRGAIGEVQLENLVRNILPEDAFAFQKKLSNETRVDCVLYLPPPTGTVAVDAKFPLENFQRMNDMEAELSERQAAGKRFKQDIRRHIDHISTKYLIPGETAEGAVMFIPAEAVFAEIHAHHGDLVHYAYQRQVWLVSPTTLMAVLNTARAVIKDIQMQEQVHVIQAELASLSVDFKRFETRLKKMTDNIRRAHDEAGQVEISRRKISEHFARIESVEGLSSSPNEQEE